jgi:hypothetical protein
VEELNFLVTAVNEEVSRSKIIVYPNPVASFLYSKELVRYRLAELYDLKGQLRATFDIQPDTTRISLEEIPQGLYLLRLTGNGLDDRIKIMKE